MSSQPPPSKTPANILPLHPVAKRRPGRPRSWRRAPDEAEREEQRRVAERLRRYVEADSVVGAVSATTERRSGAKIDAVMLAIAREAAGLAWERQQAQTQGRREVEKISSRRVDALARLANLVLERARVGVEGELDPFDPKVQRVVDSFLGQLRECANETLGSEAAAFLANFEARCADWEARFCT